MTLGSNTLKVGKKQRCAPESEKKWSVTKGGGWWGKWSIKGRVTRDVVYERALVYGYTYQKRGGMALILSGTVKAVFKKRKRGSAGLSFIGEKRALYH